MTDGIDRKMIEQWSARDFSAPLRYCVVCQEIDTTACHTAPETAPGHCLGSALAAWPTLSAVQRDVLARANSLNLMVYARHSTLRALARLDLVEPLTLEWNPWSPLTLDGFKVACVLASPDHAASLLARARSRGWTLSDSPTPTA